MPTGSAAASTSTSWWHGTTIVEMVGVYLRVNLGVGCTRFRIPAKNRLVLLLGDAASAFALRVLELPSVCFAS